MKKQCPVDIIAPREAPSRSVDASVHIQIRCRLVVLVVVDAIAEPVLTLVHTVAFTWRQLAAVHLTVSTHLRLQASFAIFEMCGFVGIQPAALDALRNAILLVLFAAANSAVAKVIFGGVVFIGINLLAEVGMLCAHLCPFGARKAAAIGVAIGANFAVDGSFLILDVGSFARGQLARPDALCDPLLLVLVGLVRPGEHGGSRQTGECDSH